MVFFQRLFTYNCEEYILEILEDWRIKNRDWIYKLGGNYMFVCCDEDESSILLDEAIQKTSDEIKDLVSEKFSDQVVNISEYIKSKQYLNKPEYDNGPIDLKYIKKIEYHIVNNIPFEKNYIKYPCFFYDDFKDLIEKKS